METTTIKQIPGTVGFMASDSGVIYGPGGEIRNQYTNGDGYKTACVKLLNGLFQTFGVHRLVALAHIETEKDVSELTVNHIDKDITNNNAYNLEWISVYLNNLHASLMRKDNDIPKLIMTNADGKKSFIRNIHEASALLEMDIDLIWDMVKNKLSVNGVQLEPFTGKTKTPIELRKYCYPKRDNDGKIIKIELSVKDLETGEISDFESIKDAAAKFNVTPSHIHQCISSQTKVSLFKRRFLIVKNGDSFPDLSPDEFDKLKYPTGRATVIWLKEDKKYIIFESASEMIRTFNLSKKAVSTRLKRDGFGEVGEHIFAYMEKAEVFKNMVKSSSSPCSFVN